MCGEDMDKLRYWCYKVLPLVYDDSLSYYEVLCKVVQKLNEVIDTYAPTGEALKEIQEEIDTIQSWIDNFDTSYAESIIKEYVAKMIYLSINDAGYIVYHIPESWSNVKFNTTGLDISNDELSKDQHYAGYDYGHLVLSY